MRPIRKVKSGLLSNISPAQFIMLNFVGLSIFGAILLVFPFANANGEFRNLVDAFFMSVSAVCVTGLATVNIGQDFSIWGQLILLILMQVGGLSYMTITTLLVYVAGRKLSFNETRTFDLSNNSGQQINFTDFVLKIGMLTFAIEFVGFLFLIPDSYRICMVEGRPFYSLFEAVFHSVSAFCNAGMSLYSTSLEAFRENYWMLFVFSLLPIIGGLGYTVLTELTQAIEAWLKARRTGGRKPKIFFSMHTKVSLVFTALLLVLGVVIQLFLIYSQDLSTLNDQGFLDKFWVSFFQTSAARSSGFNSIPLHELGDPSLLLLIVWMIIGACPGGTGGGFKTTTLAVILAIVYSNLRGDKEVTLFNRTVRDLDRRKAVTAFMATILFIIGSVWLLSIFEAGKPFRFIDHFFEVTSAFTTVGLSTGITAALSDPSKIVLCLCMIIGRPGPLLFLMALIREREYRLGRYAEEGILIG